MYYLFSVYESVSSVFSKMLLDCEFNLSNLGWYIYKIKTMEKFYRETSRVILSLIISFNYFMYFLFQIVKL